MHRISPPGKAVLLLPFLLPLLMLYPVLSGDFVPDWALTGKLLLLTVCPLVALVAFQRRYRMDSDRTDLLVSFTMSYSICLLYYNFEPFTRWLLMFGTGLQSANLLLLAYLARRHRWSYAPPACAALFGLLILFLAIWLSLTLEAFGAFAVAAALPGMILYMLLLRLPPPASVKIATPPSRCTDCTLYFGDFEEHMKVLGFDNQTIQQIHRKCNTSGHHLQHVAEYTRAICIAMGFNARQTEQISCAALLHDIGKLEIPDAILFDSGKLNNDAVSLLRSHNRFGYEILVKRDTAFFRLAADVALLHHERIDGTGYLKLKGEEIPLPARIVAVADVFDALTAPRVYKQPWDFEAAFSHILQNRGIHFDSAVVDDFLKSKAAIRQIYDSIYT